VFLRGTEHLPDQQALADATGTALDGEAIAPAGGMISGDATAGGDFSAFFVVGGEVPSHGTMRVRKVEFMARRNNADQVVAEVHSPLDEVHIERGFDTIRIQFTEPFATSRARALTTHGLDDAKFKSHSVQVRLGEQDEHNLGVPYLPGELKTEAPDIVRFVVIRGSRVVDREGRWPSGPSSFRLFLRGMPPGRGERPPVSNAAGDALDGEPIAPDGTAISGDGTAGGDFELSFVVHGAR